MSQKTRTDLRLSTELKEKVKRASKEHHSDFSTYTRDALEEKLYRESTEYKISQSIFKNKIINLLNAYSKTDPTLKESIIRELMNYDL